MEMLGKIRRMYLRDKLSLREIAKRTGMARNTLRKWLKIHEQEKDGAVVPLYQREKGEHKLSAFHPTLEQALKGKR